MTMTVYTLTTDGNVIKDGAVSVPEDPRNADWQAYQAWLIAGNIPLPVPSVTPAPPTLTYRQFRALFTTGENQAIMTAALSNNAILDWIVLAAGEGRGINMNDSLVTSGLAALVSAGLITQARANTILTGTTPQLTVGA